MGADRAYRNQSRLLDGIAEDARADARKGYGLDLFARSDFEELEVARRQEIRFPICSSAPNRADRVNDVTRRELAGSCEFGLACFAASEQAALMHKLRASSAMNRTVNAASAEQRGICSVDDRVQCKGGDVGL